MCSTFNLQRNTESGAPQIASCARPAVRASCKVFGCEACRLTPPTPSAAAVCGGVLSRQVLVCYLMARARSCCSRACSCRPVLLVVGWGRADQAHHTHQPRHTRTALPGRPVRSNVHARASAAVADGARRQRRERRRRRRRRRRGERLRQRAAEHAGRAGVGDGEARPGAHRRQPGARRIPVQEPRPAERRAAQLGPVGPHGAARAGQASWCLCRRFANGAGGCTSVHGCPTLLACALSPAPPAPVCSRAERRRRTRRLGGSARLPCCFACREQQSGPCAGKSWTSHPCLIS